MRFQPRVIPFLSHDRTTNAPAGAATLGLLRQVAGPEVPPLPEALADASRN